MAKCRECGKRFKVSDAKDDYFDRFGGDPDYEEYYSGDICGGCAIADTESLMNQGKAIDMMNGEDAYDDDFVTKWL